MRPAAAFKVVVSGFDHKVGLGGGAVELVVSLAGENLEPVRFKLPLHDTHKLMRAGVPTDGRKMMAAALRDVAARLEELKD